MAQAVFLAFGRSRDGLLDVSPALGGEEEDGAGLPDEPPDEPPCGPEDDGALAAGAFGVVEFPASATGSDEWRQ